MPQDDSMISPIESKHQCPIRWKFQFRAFVSLMVTVSFVAIVFSGVMMFLSPPGRIANWSGWQLVGLSKEQWFAVHLSFSTLFVIASLIHIWLNGGVLLGYLRNRMSKALLLRTEWIITLLLCGLLLWGTLSEVAPFNQVLVLREKAKRIWDDSSQQAPIPHAELLTLAQVAEAAKRDVATLRANLEARQIRADWDTELFGQAAARHNLTPSALYNIALGVSEQGHRGPGRGGREGGGAGGAGISSSGPGAGYGRMTLQEVCTAEKIELKQVLERLARVGIQAKPEQTLRQIADSSGKRPPEIVGLMKGE